MDITRLQSFCQLLDEHLVRYQALVDFLDEEKKCLLAMDLDGLYNSSKAKEALGRDIQEHIGLLTAAIDETALMLGFDADSRPTLAELSGRMPTPWGGRVADGANRLARLKNVILRENEANRIFINESLRLINESVNILTGANQLKGDGYQNDGSKGEKKLTLPVKLSRAV